MPPLHALVIDDSRSARFVLQRLLERHDCVVDTAEDAEQGMLKLNAGRFDVVFLDNLLPGISGFEVLEQIRAMPERVALPVVMCSSTQEPGFVDRALAVGALQVLGKPPEPETLKAVIGQLREARDTQPAEPVHMELAVELPEAVPAVPVEAALVPAVLQAEPSPVVMAEAVPADDVAPVAAALHHGGVAAVVQRLEAQVDALQQALAALHQQPTGAAAPPPVIERDAETAAAVRRLEVQVAALQSALDSLVHPDSSAAITLGELCGELDHLRHSLDNRMQDLREEFNSSVQVLRSTVQPKALTVEASVELPVPREHRLGRVDWTDTLDYGDARSQRVRHELRNFRVGFGVLAALDAAVATLVAVNIGAAPTSMLVGGALMVGVITAGLVMMHRAAEHRGVRAE